ncbi:MAG: endonuclease MutS2, partial [Alistipes sp.]|nr:endonuclease MutS2 [Alistipes sp.]
MIYPTNFEQRIGFDRIREQVMALCSMQSAREVIASESFSASQREIEQRLILADEMRLVISMESGTDIGEQDDIAAIVDKIGVEGSYITTEEAATLLRAIRSAASIVGFVLSRRDGMYPNLRRITQGVGTYP